MKIKCLRRPPARWRGDISTLRLPKRSSSYQALFSAGQPFPGGSTFLRPILVTVANRQDEEGLSRTVSPNSHSLCNLSIVPEMRATDNNPDRPPLDTTSSSANEYQLQAQTSESPEGGNAPLHTSKHSGSLGILARS